MVIIHCEGLFPNLRLKRIESKILGLYYKCVDCSKNINIVTFVVTCVHPCLSLYHRILLQPYENVYTTPDYTANHGEGGHVVCVFVA
jgi:hypothetical protein